MERFQLAPLSIKLKDQINYRTETDHTGSNMPVTIRDVAKKAQVGIGTVSRVLNNSPAVRDETRLRVISAIEELEYTPNPIARRLSTGQTLTIGVVLPYLTMPSFIALGSVLSGCRGRVSGEHSVCRSSMMTRIRCFGASGQYNGRPRKCLP